MGSGIRLTAVLAYVLLGPACGDSLFDSGGSSAEDDGGAVSDGGAVDAAEGAADAGGPFDGTCTGTCVADLGEDFDLTQGSADLSYLGDERANRQGTAYRELTEAADALGGAPGWSAGPDNALAMVRCADAPSLEQCTGIEDYVLIVPDSANTDIDPVVAFEVPATGAYQLAARHRTPSTANTGSLYRLLVARNARYDLLHIEDTVASHDEQTFVVDFEAIAGDRILLTVDVGNAATDAALGLDFRIVRNEQLDPGACSFALRFEDDTAPTFAEECTNAGALTVTDSGTGGATAPTSVPSVPGLGNGMKLEPGWNLELAKQLDFSSDFTISFWAQLNLSGGIGEPAFVGNHAATQQGGAILFIERVPQRVWGCVAFGGDGRCANFTVGESDLDLLDWHYVRFVRATSTGDIELCIDGPQTSAGATSLPSGNEDLTAPSALPIQIGKEDGRAAVFDGSIDDVRILRRALPCRL